MFTHVFTVNDLSLCLALKLPKVPFSQASMIRKATRKKNGRKELPTVTPVKLILSY